MISLFCCMCLRLTAVRAQTEAVSGDHSTDSPRPGALRADGHVSYDSSRSEVCWCADPPCRLLSLLVVVIGPPPSVRSVRASESARGKSDSIRLFGDSDSTSARSLASLALAHRAVECAHRSHGVRPPACPRARSPPAPLRSASGSWRPSLRPRTPPPRMLTLPPPARTGTRARGSRSRSRTGTDSHGSSCSTHTASAPAAGSTRRPAHRCASGPARIPR